MFEQLFERQHALSRHISGPLADERRRYLAHCAAQGMATRTLRLTAQLLIATEQYLNLSERPDEIISRQEVDEAGTLWSSRKSLPPIQLHPKLSRQRFIHHAVGWLTFLNRIQNPAKPVTAYDQMLSEFADFMLKERGLSPATIESRCCDVRSFLKRVCDGERPLSTITVADIDSALAQSVNDGHYARATVQTCASSLRAFFRYAEKQCWCAAGLAASIMAPRVFQHESLPSGPSWDAVQKILASTAGDRPAAIRDHAILLLLAVYGVRAGEVARLRLSDIDWQGETIVFTRSKLLGSHLFPLCQTVGEAIIRYLKEARAASSHRELFLTTRAPYRPITSGTLWPVVSRRLRPLGLSIQHHGPHSLRHACATRLINEGLSLKEVGDLLGHRGPETTRIYAKLDLVRLREVASFDLGGLL
jgi:site-specific recombinase XerD